MTLDQMADFICGKVMGMKLLYPDTVTMRCWYGSGNTPVMRPATSDADALLLLLRWREADPERRWFDFGSPRDGSGWFLSVVLWSKEGPDKEAWHGCRTLREAVLTALARLHEGDA